MKIFAAGIATETNTFAPVLTGLEDFMVVRGRDVRAGVVQYPSLDLSAIWGKRARARGCEFVFGLNAWAEPGGITVKSAYESLRDELLEALSAAMPVDVVLLMLHGAMVAREYDDCERDIIARVREIVGPNTVVGVELDLHCQLTAEKIAAADLIVTYKEYPHVDVEERAGELFDLAMATALHQVRPTKALFDCRMVGLYPTSEQPLRGFVEAMTLSERLDGVLSISFAHGFPFADLPHVSAKVLVITDDNPALAKRTAAELGLKVYGLRRQIGFDALSLSIEAAFARALASPRQPVVVADQSDNVGAGAPGDATFALRWLLDHGVGNAAMAIFYDPEVVKVARRAGVGARIPLRLGGKMGKSSGDPVDMEATVLSLRDDYLHRRPQNSGHELTSPLGDTAALSSGTIDIVVSSKRCQCYSPSIFSDHGIDFARKRLLIPKSTQHFYAAFAAVAGEIIYMAAPGAVAPDPRHIPYRRLITDNFYPWNDDPLARSCGPK